MLNRGIIHVDEIDKIAKKSENIYHVTFLVRGVQQALLRKIIEGTVAECSTSEDVKHPQQR